MRPLSLQPRSTLDAIMWSLTQMFRYLHIEKVSRQRPSTTIKVHWECWIYHTYSYPDWAGAELPKLIVYSRFQTVVVVHVRALYLARPEAPSFSSKRTLKNEIHSVSKQPLYKTIASYWDKMWMFYQLYLTICIEMITLMCALFALVYTY